MQYQGSKKRLSKTLKPFIEQYIKSDSIYVEPFMGGCNMLTEIDAKIKYGYDYNEYVVEFFKALQNNSFYPPDFIDKETYDKIKKDKEYQDNNKPLTAWVALGCSFGAKWFGGYAKDVTKAGKSRQMIARNGLDKQIPKLKNIIFNYSSYDDIEIQENMVVYCDPPYADTLKYKDDFDSEKFWDWVLEKSEICPILISEYKKHSNEKYSDIIPIFTKDVNCAMDECSNRTEKLFIHKKWVKNDSNSKQY